MIGSCSSAKLACGVSAGRGWGCDSINPSPARPARVPPDSEKVACQIPSARSGCAGYSLSPPGIVPPANAPRIGA
jgi:hypothetical protein